MDTSLRIEGSIYGLLVGNALAERCSNSTDIEAAFPQLLARYYTDAGAMTLCTMASLNDSERLDLDDLGYRFQEWYLGSYLVSSEQKIRSRVTISQAMRMYGNGMPFDRCGAKINPADNSALLRMLPIALWNSNESLMKLVREAHQTTLFTNQQVEAQVCSAIYCLMIRLLLKQEKKPILAVLEEEYANSKLSDHSLVLAKIKEHFESAPEYFGSSEARDGLWTTISLIKEESDDFEGIMKKALLLREDREATASLAGSLAGLSFGVNEIPLRWIKQLELSDEAQTVIHEFIRKCLKRI